MEHTRSVIDSDKRFTINPVTRQIKNESGKTTLIQHDHNSERFVFSLQRYVEGHDMAECNKVEVLYLNIESGKKAQCSGVYTVEDLHISEDDESLVVCSWLISGNSTVLAGTLNFLLRYRCMDETMTLTQYAWHTATYEGIKVSTGIDADERFEEEYVDVIAQWKASVLQEFNAEIKTWEDASRAELDAAVAAWKETESAEVRRLFGDYTDYWQKQVEAERARIDGFVALKDGSTTGDAELLDIRIGANGVKYSSAGTAVREQINQIAHEMTYVKSLNRIDNTSGKSGYYAKQAANENETYVWFPVIQVTPGETLYGYGRNKADGVIGITPIVFVDEYDENGNWIRFVRNEIEVDNSYTVPDDVHYAIISMYSVYDAHMVTESETKPESVIQYEKPYYALPKNDVINAYLPRDIYCAVGRTIELYNNQVCLQSQKHHVRWVCAVGKAMQRKFSVTGAETLVGDHELKCEIYNDAQKLVWSGSTTLHIVQPMSDNKTICPIGDSLTNSKPWAAEVVNLSGGRVEYVGTRGGSNLKDADGNWRKVSHEGRSGFTSKNYVNGDGDTYTTPHENSNPFWDGATFSWEHYRTETGINPNAVQIWLGINGISDDNSANAGYILQMVESIRRDDPNIPIFVVNTMYQGNQNGIGVQQSSDGYASKSGVYKYAADLQVMDLMKNLDGLVAGLDGVYMINLALTHDSENNFGSVETPVNPRAQQFERLPVESVHPQEQGYFQCADVIFSVYSGIF